MNALISLYDALVSINVPADKAKAVVDAMERDASFMLATKSDIAPLRKDIEGFRAETKSEFALLRQELQALRAEWKADIALLRQELDTTRTLVARDLRKLEATLTIRLGSMMVAGVGVLYALQRLGH
jgi:hypothetical protein